MHKRKRSDDAGKRSTESLSGIASRFDDFLSALNTLIERTPAENFSTRGLSSDVEDRVVIAKVLKRMRLRGQLSWMDQYLKDEVDTSRLHSTETVSSEDATKSAPTSDHSDSPDQSGEDGCTFPAKSQARTTRVEESKEQVLQGLASANFSTGSSDLSTWPPTLPEIRDQGLLKQAFTHRSYATACAPAQSSKVFLTSLHNERLEFLGDSFLNHSVTKMLFVRMPDSREGEMSLLRAELIGNTTAASFGRLYGFDRRLLLNDTAERDGVRKTPKVIADTFEAYLGAIILDGRDGVRRADDWLKALMNPRIAEYLQTKVNEPVDTFAKQKLWNHFSKKYPPPTFAAQPDQAHSPAAVTTPQPLAILIKYEWVDGGGGNEGGFIVAAKLSVPARGIDGQELGRGFGLNKKEAEHRAAMDAVKSLGL